MGNKRDKVVDCVRQGTTGRIHNSKPIDRAACSKRSDELLKEPGVCACGVIGAENNGKPQAFGIGGELSGTLQIVGIAQTFELVLAFELADWKTQQHSPNAKR